jgi:glycosyltransferase involved in cell wall biosynthesis
MRLVRVAVNVEQLLYRSPGGIGRYTAQIMSLMPEQFPGDEILPFCALHYRRRVRSAVPGRRLAVLPLPRQALYPAWHRFGLPPLGLLAPHLRSADLVHAPSVAVPATGLPLVVTVHDAAPELYPEAFPARGLRFHRSGIAAAARRARLVVTVSEAAADEIVRLTPIPADKVRVVANGVAPVRVAPAEKAAVLSALGLEGRPFVLWVGSLEPRKNVPTLVAAMERLRRGAETGAALVLAGYEGWLGGGGLAADARSSLGADLVLAGRLGETDLWALYSAASVVALPSVHEGFGYPVLEAMSLGTPVVCSDIPALRELTGDAAVLVPATDVDAWAEALAGLLDDEAQRRRLGEAGHMRSGLFSVERMMTSTRAVYQEALGKG